MLFQHYIDLIELNNISLGVNKVFQLLDYDLTKSIIHNYYSSRICEVDILYTSVISTVEDKVIRQLIDNDKNRFLSLISQATKITYDDLINIFKNEMNNKYIGNKSLTDLIFSRIINLSSCSFKNAEQELQKLLKILNNVKTTYMEANELDRYVKELIADES